MVETAAVQDCTIVQDQVPDRLDAGKLRAEALTAQDRPGEYVDVKTAPHAASPGQADWTNYAVSSNLFPGGPVREASANPTDARHIEFEGKFYDSYFPSYRTQFKGKDIKNDEGRLAHREVDLTYMDVKRCDQLPVEL